MRGGCLKKDALYRMIGYRLTGRRGVIEVKRQDLWEMIRHSSLAEKIAFCAVTIASVCSLVYSIYKGSVFHITIFVLVILLMFLPILFEWFFRVRLSVTMKVLFMILIGAGPILGDVFGFYVRFTHWDTFLHAVTGFFMALIGFLLPDVLNRDVSSRISMPTRLLSAFTFGLAAAAVWELYEFIGDTLWGTDMQASTVIHVLHSKHLGDSPYLVDTIDDIFDVIINGSELGLGGYLDIGLIDTMEDMLSNTAGIVLYCVLALAASRKREGRLARLLLPRYTWEEEEASGEDA